MPKENINCTTLSSSSSESKNEGLLNHGGKRLFALNRFLITNPNSWQNTFNESVPCKSCSSSIKIMENKNQWHGLGTQHLIICATVAGGVL